MGMAIDNQTLVRKRIGDDRKTETESLPINETTVTVQLRYSNATIFSLIDRNKSSVALVENTDYTLHSESGIITLLYTPDPDSTLIAVYYYYAFTDAEIDDLINAYGINGACAEAIRWLIADSSRLHDYSRGATSESLSQIVKNLQSMLKDYSRMGDSTTGKPVGMTILKRTNDWYRTKTTETQDLSRDDSLML